MNALQIRLSQLDKDYISYNMEQTENDPEVNIVLSIYYGYYNQFLEFYDKNGDLISREHCNYNDFT